MFKKNTSALSLVTLALVTLAPGLALAANDGQGPQVVNWWGALSEQNADAPALGWMFVTFFMFCAIIYLSVRRPLATYLANRSDEIKNALEEAKQARAEAEAKAREYEERLANLDNEIESLKQEFRTRGEAEVRRLEQAGKDAAARISKDAEDTIAAEFERAQHALKQEATRLALELAEDRVREVIKVDDHQRLEKAFLGDVARPN